MGSAGISTSAGVPDYRSSADTVLKTGPGIWTKEEIPADQTKQEHSSKEKK